MEPLILSDEEGAGYEEALRSLVDEEGADPQEINIHSPAPDATTHLWLSGLIPSLQK
jgi:hypothetical protein